MISGPDKIYIGEESRIENREWRIENPSQARHPDPGRTRLGDGRHEKALLALWLTGCSSATVDPELAERAVRVWHQRLDSEPLARVVITPIPGNTNLFLAIWDTQTEWWGSFDLFHLAEGFIDRIGTCSEGPDDQSIHRIRVVEVPEFRGSLVEVLGITHMGNGYLCLYELCGKEHLQLLLKSKAVDFNADVEKFRDGVLQVEYRDENGDVLVSSRPCRRVHHWNASQGRFE